MGTGLQDAHGNEIRVGDTVRVAPHAQRDAAVGPVVRVSPEAGANCNLTIARAEVSLSKYTDRDVVAIYATLSTVTAAHCEIIRTVERRVLRAGPFTGSATECEALMKAAGIA